jgi:hypothetical protein
MLRDVVYYKLAFERLKSYEHIYPSPKGHENAQTLFPFFWKFYELTELLFGPASYLIVNLALVVFVRLNLCSMLNDWCRINDPTISKMANVMIKV